MSGTIQLGGYRVLVREDFRATLVRSFPEPLEDKASQGQNRDAEENSGYTANLRAGENSEDYQ